MTLPLARCVRSLRDLTSSPPLPGARLTTGRPPAPPGGAGAFDSGQVSIAFVPAGALLAFGYYGLDYCANQLQNPFIAEFGDVQLDGRFANAVCEDIDMLLLCETPGVIEPTRESEPKLVA